MVPTLLDGFRKIWFTVTDAAGSFRRNNDLSAAASLAFAAMLALIPALFLLTTLLGFAVGSSQEALRGTRDLVAQFIPAYSREILREVGFLTTHTKAIGIVNGVVLLWTITPLVAELRSALGVIFRRRLKHPFLLEKLIDVASTVLFLIGMVALAVAGVMLRLADRVPVLGGIARYLSLDVSALFMTAVIFLLYLLFAPRVPARRLLAGAAVASLLWFILRPAFTYFLTYNPGYGFAFGSFKSLFVVIIWIYYSLVVFLIGAEVAAGLGRKEVVAVRRLLEGKRGVPRSVMRNYVVSLGAGDVVFSEGDPGREMFSVRRGSVAVRKDGRDVAVIGEGENFGEMAFLLEEPRTATAVALEDTELIVVNEASIAALMNDFPEFVIGMLRDMAVRLRDANRMIG